MAKTIVRTSSPSKPVDELKRKDGQTKINTGQNVDLNSVDQPIILPQVKDRWLGLNLRSYNAETVKATLDQTNYGGLLHYQQTMLELLEETWPRVGRNLFHIRSAVQHAKWEVKPFCKQGEKPTSTAQEKAKFVQELIDGMKSDPITGLDGFSDTVFSLMDSYGKGLSVCEIDWTQQRSSKGGGGFVFVPRGTRWIRPIYYDYPKLPLMVDRLMLSVSGKPLTDLVDFPENKFIVSAMKFRSATHYGRVGMLRTLAPWWIFTNFATEWMMMLGQIFGMPIRWANYKPGADKNIVAQMLRDMGSTSWGVFPEGTILTLHQNSQSAGQNPNAYIMETGDKLADIVLLDQTLTTDVGDSGSRAIGEVHERGLTDRENIAALGIASALTPQLAGAILRLNYGNDDECPTITPDTEEEGDALAMAQASKTLFLDMKIPVSKEFLYDEHGIPQPKDGADLYEPPAEPVPVITGNANENQDSKGGAKTNRTQSKPGKTDSAVKKKVVSALEAIDLPESIIEALESLDDAEFIEAIDGTFPIGLVPRDRYRKGQIGGGRYMSKKVVSALEDVKTIMSKWPVEGNHRADRYIKAFDLPDNANEFRAYTAPGMHDIVDQRSRDVKESSDVSFDKLKTTQSRIDGEKVMSMMMRAQDSEKPANAPIVIKRSNMLWLWDGHHRAAKGKVMGEASMKCRVVDMEDFKP